MPKRSLMPSFTLFTLRFEYITNVMFFPSSSFAHIKLKWLSILFFAITEVRFV